ncbi:hypothetical protein [Undibacterium sp.]|uniref:hypothetical protein n=1 Tax=Undibacterium sp. TaxID=1914977 RepID=UPI003520B356
MECRTSPLAEYTHSAISVTREAFEVFSQKADAGEFQLWKTNQSEGDSPYLLDPNGYKLELHEGDWQTRLESFKHFSYEGLIIF